MIRAFVQALTSPVAGPVGFVLAALMCALLVMTAGAASRHDQAARARISALTAENLRNTAALTTRLASCESGATQNDPRLTHASTEARAGRLAGQGPAGFDACARMGAADRAVLGTLK